MIESGIDVPRGLCQSAGGAFYLAYRGLKMAAAKLHLNGATPLGKAALATHAVGNAFFNLFYIAITAWSFYGYYKNAQFSNHLEKASESSETLVSFFEKNAVANPLSTLSKTNLPELRKKYFNLALEVLTDRLFTDLNSMLAGEEENSSPTK